MKHYILTMIETPNDWTDEELKTVMIEQRQAVIATYYRNSRGTNMGNLVFRADKIYDAHGKNIEREWQALDAIYDAVMSNAKEAERVRRELKDL